MSRHAAPLDVVTGGAGFIGSHLAEALLARKRSVRIVDDLSGGSKDNVPPGAEFIEADVLEVADRACRGASVVYHLAAIPSVPYSVEHPVESHRAGVDTTLALLQAAERAGVRRVVFASSSAVYGDGNLLPRRENQEPHPLSPYALDKLCAEMYLAHWATRGKLQTVSLRFFNVYGPRQDPRSPYAAVISLFIERILAGKSPRIFGDGRQSRDFVHVADVARGLVAAGFAENFSSRVYNIASGKATCVEELARTVANVSKKPLRVEHLARRPGDVLHSWADVSLAKRDLGFSAEVPLEEGIRSTIEWYANRSGVGAAAQP